MIISIDDFIKKININIIPTLLYSTLDIYNIKYDLVAFDFKDKESVINKKANGREYLAIFSIPSIEFMKLNKIPNSLTSNIVISMIIYNCDIDYLCEILNKTHNIKGFL